MGLDAYVRVTTKEVPDGINETEEIWYGRKENEIHGWMQRQSGIAAEDFNCVPLPLTAELLDQFESIFKLKLLVPTSGFFFGSANEPNEVVEAAQALLDASRKTIAEGKEPYYTSWW